MLFFFDSTTVLKYPFPHSSLPLVYLILYLLVCAITGKCLVEVKHLRGKKQVKNSFLVWFS